MGLKERFLKYIAIDTQSDEKAGVISFADSTKSHQP